MEIRVLMVKRIVILFLCLICCNKSNAQLDIGTTIATWNIGHFSMGHKDYSFIKASEYETKVKEYRDFIYNKLNADVLCVNEYESEFCHDSIKGSALAEDVLFDEYRIQRILKKNRYVCNAIFSNIDLKNVRKKKYNFSPAPAKNIKSISWFYFVTTDILIDGEPVKLVCTHLINRHEDECQRQMDQLIEELKPYKRVVICGDLNSSDWSKFKNAGYVFANDGSTVTFPRRNCALDNIIVKGLKILEVRVIKNKLSDHYPVVCRVSTQ